MVALEAGLHLETIQVTAWLSVVNRQDPCLVAIRSSHLGSPLVDPAVELRGRNL